MVAVVEGIGQPVHLYGYSFEGACIVEAVTRVDNLAGLILYEGSPKLHGLRFIPDVLVVRLETLIRVCPRKELLSLFRSAELDVLEQAPAWPE